MQEGRVIVALIVAVFIALVALVPVLQTECLDDSDCVPATCCHPASCVPKEQAPDCSRVVCTQECVPGTMDCGQGYCVCENGRCRAVIRGVVGLPNPASVYCEEQGYELEIRTDQQGGQYGVCVFPDGSECEEWEFYRGECGPGMYAEVSR